jgi:hypothetical protein
MILTDDDVKERIESPLNLLNRLRTSLDRAVDGASNNPHSIVPQLPPKAEDLIPDLEEKIQNKTARSKAMGIMTAAMSELESRLPEIRKAETLSQIAWNMSRVIASADDSAHHRSGTTTAQIIVYAPQVQSLDNFEVIDIKE